MSTRRPPGRTLVVLAAAVGLVHSAASLSWALGSTWLLDTVGDAAPAALAESGIPVAVALAAVGIVKAGAAITPVLVDRQLLPWRALWRTVSWIGGSGLVLYGSVNAVVAALVLAGALNPEGGYDLTAMMGHALLWDPLFALWGALLTGSLWRSRGRPSR